MKTTTACLASVSKTQYIDNRKILLEWNLFYFCFANIICKHLLKKRKNHTKKEKIYIHIKMSLIVTLLFAFYHIINRIS